MVPSDPLLQVKAYAELAVKDLATVEMRVAALTPDECRRYIAAFEARYPELIRQFRALNEAFRATAPTVRSAADAFSVYQGVRDYIPASPKDALPDDKRLRYSSKTGATWPKPKGGY